MLISMMVFYSDNDDYTNYNLKISNGNTHSFDFLRESLYKNVSVGRRLSDRSKCVYVTSAECKDIF